MTQSRLLPTVLLAASSWLLISLFGSQQSLSIELGKNASSNSGVAQNEFDKKFRKSDEFSQDLPEEKIQSFAKVLKKFFDNEKDDYKKDADQRTPDYDALKNKAALVSYDF
ncbi:tdp2, partial [Symbiodinium necroappetens]